MPAGISLESIKAHHEKIIELFKNMSNVTDDFIQPLDACGSYCITYARLKDLEKMMKEYIHVENNVLFARME